MMKTFAQSLIEKSSVLVVEESAIGRKDFIKNYYHLNRPILFKGAASRWDLAHQWSLEYFKQNYGQEKVDVEIGHLFECVEATASGEIGKIKKIKIPLGQLVDFLAVKNPKERVYLTEWRFLDQLPGAKDYFPKNKDEITNWPILSAPTIYMGPAGAFTPLHFDHAPNFIVQIQGAKRWTFASPEFHNKLYPFPKNSQLGHFSRANTPAKMQDFESYPELQNVSFSHFDAHKDDIIYVPPQWWHHVETLQTSFSVHLFWKTKPQYMMQILSAPVRFFNKQKYRSHCTIKGIDFAGT